jgi:phosphohistidine phosphatase
VTVPRAARLNTRFLTLVRHARASPPAASERDFERPLTLEGRNEARAAAERFADSGPTPDLLISSPAPRALETTRIFAAALALPADSIAIEPELYNASVDDIETVLARTPADVNHAAVFGHNPGVSEFARAVGADLELGDLGTAGGITFQLDMPDWGTLDLAVAKILGRF